MRKSKLLSLKEVKEQFPRIPQKGLWYEIIDFSNDDATWSNDWGFYGFLHGNHIYNSGNAFSRIQKAGDAAREWKQQELDKWRKAQLERVHRKAERELRS